MMIDRDDFEIVDDIIFCGYGFTAEPDYLYQLDIYMPESNTFFY